ncbi:MAG TPA: acyl-CoA thioesterase [Anaerolineales bacterium]|nr:acyl-CoA thioesterase [Anaerolineales bacterium]
MTAPDPETPPVPTGKTCAASRVSVSQLMNPNHANLLGNVHGGWIMKLVDEAGALASMRHAQQRVVTVALDQMTFRHPILIGDLVTLTSEVSYAGTTSMEVEVRVVAENPISGLRTYTNTAYLVYVALDERGRPVPVPRLIPETDAERDRMEAGRLRQEYRKQQRESG